MPLFDERQEAGSILKGVAGPTLVIRTEAHWWPSQKVLSLRTWCWLSSEEEPAWLPEGKDLVMRCASREEAMRRVVYRADAWRESCNDIWSAILHQAEARDGRLPEGPCNGGGPCGLSGACPAHSPGAPPREVEAPAQAEAF